MAAHHLRLEHVVVDICSHPWVKYHVYNRACITSNVLGSSGISRAKVSGEPGVVSVIHHCLATGSHESLDTFMVTNIEEVLILQVSPDRLDDEISAGECSSLDVSVECDDFTPDSEKCFASPCRPPV